jgi:hypothetical protein
MAGLVPAIHAFLWPNRKNVDARDKRGHDDAEFVCNASYGNIAG